MYMWIYVKNRLYKFSHMFLIDSGGTDMWHDWLYLKYEFILKNGQANAEETTTTRFIVVQGD
jgi:hypothetical protein